MKEISLIVFTIIYCATAQSQITYSKRIDFDLPVSTFLTSIEINDSCYYATGIVSDTLPPFYLGGLFTKISLDGEVVSYNSLLSNERYCQTINNALEPTIDGNFMVGGTCLDTLGRSALLIKYTPEGDSIFTKQYRSPYYPESHFIALISSQKSLVDDGAYLVSNITNTVNSNSDIYLQKVNSFGELEWATIYGENQNSESVDCIYLLENNVCIGGGYHNLNFSTQDYISRALLIWMDNQGVVEWEYLSPEGELIKPVSDVLITDDGGYLLASGKGEIVGSPSSNFVSWKPYVFKLDEDREFEWGVDIRDSLPQTTNVINKIIEVSDNSGYVIAGRTYQPNPTEGGYDYLGLVAKISNEGDSLWSRRYNYVQSAADDHVFYDIEESPDGGFVMVGQATDFNQQTGEYPLQRAWLVKTDQHGCLVPDCHLSTSTDDLQKTTFDIKVFPNPATDFINVHFQSLQSHPAAHFQLTDASGKVCLAFENRHSEITHMIPTDGLASGSYWLTCQVGAEVLSRMVVVE